MLRSTQSFLKQAAKLSRPSPSSAAPRAPSSSNQLLLIVTSRASSTDARATELSWPSISSTAPRASSPSNKAPVVETRRASSTDASPSSDYDQIMRATVTAFSSVAGGAHSPTPSLSPSAAQVPSGVEIAQQRVVNSNCYRTVDEPTEREDYDEHELYHPPCERMQECDSYATTTYFDEAA